MRVTFLGTGNFCRRPDDPLRLRGLSLELIREISGRGPRFIWKRPRAVTSSIPGPISAPNVCAKTFGKWTRRS